VPVIIRRAGSAASPKDLTRAQVPRV
jgi:hypothetical protein